MHDRDGLATGRLAKALCRSVMADTVMRVADNV